MQKLKIQIKADLLKSLIGNRKIPLHNLSEKSGITVEQLQSMQTDDTEIDLSSAKKLANCLYRPWTVFLLENAESPPQFGEDHRTLANYDHKLTPEVLHILEEANYIIDVAKEINPSNQLKLPKFNSQTIENAERLAEAVRKHFNCSIEDQFSLNGQYQALHHWKDMIQEMGIYVAEKPLPVKEVRAFSIRRKNFAIIVVSTKDTPYGRIFSLFHELCHILLKHPGVCDFVDKSNTNSIEPFCNQFASAFLIPRTILTETLDQDRLNREILTDPVFIADIARKFRVSKLALFTRLLTLGYISRSDYSNIYDKINVTAEFERKSKGGGNYYLNVLNSMGQQFSHDVFSAQSEGKISYGDVGRIMGVSIRNVEKLREALFSSGAQNASAD